MKKVILSALCALSLSSMILLTGCGSSDSSSNESKGTANSQSTEDKSLQHVLDNGKLILGLDATFKPMGYTDENDKIVGFDIDLAEEVCKRMGITLETYGINWDTKEIELNAGTIDCIWNGLSVSDSRKKEMLMSESYMNNEMVFAVNKDSEFKTLDDLNGKTIAVQNGSTAQKILLDSDIASKITPIEIGTNVEALNQLELGMCDAVFLDSVVADFEITSGKPFKTLEEGLEKEEYAIGFKLGNEALCKKVEDTLKEMKADGKVAEISTKWFGSDITTIG